MIRSSVTIARRDHTTSTGAEARAQFYTRSQRGSPDSRRDRQKPSSQSPGEFRFKDAFVFGRRDQALSHNAGMFRIIRHHAVPRQKAKVVRIFNQPPAPVCREPLIRQPQGITDGRASKEDSIAGRLVICLAA